MGQGYDADGRITGEDVFDALQAHDEPVATTTDIASVFGLTTEAVRRHLNNLHEAGCVHRKRTGASAVVWWPSTESTADATEEEVTA
jgi:predicted ArsR family transcriptional regulator